MIAETMLVAAETGISNTGECSRFCSHTRGVIGWLVIVLDRSS